MGVLVSKWVRGTFLKQLPCGLGQSYQIVRPISSLISEDPAYRFDVREERIILEGGTTWYAAQRASREDLVHIRHYYDQISHFQSLGNDDEAARADAKFHLAIAEASHNLVLIQMMRGLFDLLQFNVVLGRRKVYTEAHRLINCMISTFKVMDAIERRDPEAARKAVCGHIEFVVQQVRMIDEEEARRQRASRLNRI